MTLRLAFVQEKITHLIEAMNYGQSDRSINQSNLFKHVSTMNIERNVHC